MALDVAVAGEARQKAQRERPSSGAAVAPAPVRVVGSDLPVISAADLEKFGYCPLSWWRSLDAQAAPSAPPLPKDSEAQLAAGQKAHEEAGESLKEIRSGELVVAESEEYIWRFAAVSAGIAIFGFILTALGLEGWPQSLIPMAISLVWLLTAVLLFRLALKYYQRVRARREAFGVKEDAAVVYVGEGKTVDEDPALFSHRLGLVGAPDTIVEREGLFIPVELKTGRVPKGPFFSHVLQVVAYCALVEEKYARAPPYGIIKYGPASEFEVEYGETQKRLLESMLSQMREAFVTKDVHRNHDRPGKCANCSRREGCPERLDKPQSGT